MTAIDTTTQEFARQFLTMPEEKLLLATKTHWLTAAVPIFWMIFTGIGLMVFLLIIDSTITHHALFSLSSIFTVFLVTLVLIIKTLMEWYYHIYIISNRKIVEIVVSPLLSHNINEVLLDQVRCTEIDVQTKGIIHELFDMGDVIITFDRPTHQEAFSLINIHHPESLGMFLSDAFLTPKENSETMWFRSKMDPKQMQMINMNEN